MNSKQIKQGALIAFIIYLIWVFIGLEFNPIKWDISARLMYVLFTIGSIIVAITFPDNEE